MSTEVIVASFFGDATFELSAEGDNFARQWIQRLCPLDTPMASCPSGLDPQFKYGVTSDAVAQGGHLIRFKPMRMSQGLDSHKDFVLSSDGTVVKEFAPAIGVHSWQEIREEDGQKYWYVGGTWWPDEDPKLAARVAREKEILGGSWELTFQVDKQPDESGVKWIRKITGAKGSATLRRASAAAGDASMLIAAEEEKTNTEQVREAMLTWLGSHDETDVAIAAAGRGGKADMAETADLAAKIAEASERNGELVAQNKSLAEELDGFVKALAEAGVKTISELIAQRDSANAKVEEVNEALAESAKTIAEYEGVVKELGKESINDVRDMVTDLTTKLAEAEDASIKAQADAWMTANASRYQPQIHEVVKSAFIANLRGEALNAEQFSAMASGTEPVKPPEGNDSDIEPAKAEAGSSNPAQDIYEELEAKLHTEFGGDRQKLQKELSRRLTALVKEV